VFVLSKWHFVGQWFFGGPRKFTAINGVEAFDAADGLGLIESRGAFVV